MSVPRDALERSIGGRLGACSHDELRVLDLFLVHLEIDREQNGALDLSRDERHFVRKDKTLLDGAILGARELLRRRDRTTATLRQLADDEMRTRISAGLVELRDATPFDVGGES